MRIQEEIKIRKAEREINMKEAMERIEEHRQVDGLSVRAHPALRDYFAAMAMQGILATRLNDDSNYPVPSKTEEDASAVADWAYEYADAMINARKENK
jgi:hypothetical protein